jgi:hypothetical protein
MPTVLTRTIQELIEGALRLLQVSDANQSIDASETQDTLEALNDLLKNYQKHGLHLWTKTEGVLFLDVGKTDYLLGPTGDEATTKDDFISTELSVAGVATDVIINVDSTAGMVAADIIGVLLDDGTRHWTTIVSVDSSLLLTINTGLPSGAAIDNSVFTYTTILDRPVRILQARRDTIGSTSDEVVAHQWSREEYFAQPNKTSQGTTNNWYYSPLTTNGRMYVWQTANSADQIVRFTFERPIDVYTDISDSILVPAEWYRVLKFNLAADIGPDTDVTTDRLNYITEKAKVLLDDALGSDQEFESISIQPNFGG